MVEMQDYKENTDIARKSMIVDLTCDVCNKVFGKCLLFSRDTIYQKPRCSQCLIKYPITIIPEPRY